MFSSSPKVDPQKVYLSSQFLFQKATSMSSSGQKSSSVAQTCNLLSQYFKENGRFASKPAANQGTSLFFFFFIAFTWGFELFLVELAWRFRDEI